MDDLLKDIERIRQEGIDVPLDEALTDTANAVYDELREKGKTDGWPVVFGVIKNDSGQLGYLIATPDENLSDFRLYCLAVVDEATNKSDLVAEVLADAQARIDGGTSPGLE